jgi:hypothetical protein
MIPVEAFPYGGTDLMPGHDERWMQLCEQAAVEQDPEKLMKLVEEINRLLEAKQNSAGVKLPDPDVNDGACGS